MKANNAVWGVIVLALVLSGPSVIAADSPGAVVDGFYAAYRGASLEGMLASYAPP